MLDLTHTSRLGALRLPELLLELFDLGLVGERRGSGWAMPNPPRHGAFVLRLSIPSEA